MRYLILFFCFMGFAVAQEKPDSPKPKPVARERAANKAFWLGSVAMGASAAVDIEGGNICRRNNGVEPCTEHYGAFNLWEGIVAGSSVILGPALFYGCRKDYANSRWCWVIPGVVIGGNVGWGIHEAGIHHPDLTPESVPRRKR